MKTGFCHNLHCLLSECALSVEKLWFSAKEECCEAQKHNIFLVVLILYDNLLLSKCDTAASAFGIAPPPPHPPRHTHTRPPILNNCQLAAGLASC